MLTRMDDRISRSLRPGTKSFSGENKLLVTFLIKSTDGK